MEPIQHDDEPRRIRPLAAWLLGHVALGGVCALIVGLSYLSKFLFWNGPAWLGNVFAVLGVSWLLAFAGLVFFGERAVVPVLILLGWFVGATSVGLIAVAAGEERC